MAAMLNNDPFVYIAKRCFFLEKEQSHCPADTIAVSSSLKKKTRSDAIVKYCESAAVISLKNLFPLIIVLHLL